MKWQIETSTTIHPEKNPWPTLRNVMPASNGEHETETEVLVISLTGRKLMQASFRPQLLPLQVMVMQSDLGIRATAALLPLGSLAMVIRTRISRDPLRTSTSIYEELLKTIISKDVLEDDDTMTLVQVDLGLFDSP